MEIGKIGAQKDALFDAMFADDGRFALPEGEIGMVPGAAAALYAPRIRKLFEDEGFGDFDVAVNGSDIEFLAFNAEGSSVSLGMRVDDALGLAVDWASGVSVQNGNEISLDWWFEDCGMKFQDVAELKRFVDQFKNW